MKSIRKDLMVRLVLGAGAIIALGGIVLAMAMHHALTREFDRVLEAKAQTLSALASLEGDVLEIDYDPDYFPQFEDDDDPEYFQIRMGGGEVLLRSGSLDAALAIDAVPPIGEPEFRNIPLPDGRRGRVVHRSVEPRLETDGPPPGFEPVEEGEVVHRLSADASGDAIVLVVSVARGREGLDAVLWGLWGTLVLVAALSLAGIALLTWTSIGRGLRPIGDINQQMHGITSDSLDSRVELSDPPAELRGIVSAVNDLTARLQSAFERERRFSSDVAHELRTPVSELRTASEVGARWPEDEEATRELFEDVREIAIHMETVVNSLLMLSACENGKAAVASGPVDLQKIVSDCWNRNDRLARERVVRFECRVAAGEETSTDRDKLELIIQNLVDNAARYSEPESVVRCYTENGGSTLDLVIENDVRNLDEEDLKHLTERFWRKDPTGTHGNHAGLGLSIVRALCEILGIGFAVRLHGRSALETRLSFSPPAPAASP